MHTYSINSSERMTVFFFIALISIVFVGLIRNCIEWLGLEQIEQWIPIVSAFTIYGFFGLIFDKWLWKASLFRKLGLIQTPVVEGVWKGTMQSSADQFANPYGFTLRIHQTWRSISIYLDGDTRASVSTMATFKNCNPSISNFEWGFLSTSKPHPLEKEYMYYGVSRIVLDFDDEGKVLPRLNGDYFTDKSQNTYGRIQLEKVK